MKCLYFEGGFFGCVVCYLVGEINDECRVLMIVCGFFVGVWFCLCGDG